ncbi:MAG: bifunctional hydroxymethylpyrimidine kinase/phosphomethylpyrimidine kinase [Solirubrobacteraceae bacterium]
MAAQHVQAGAPAPPFQPARDRRTPVALSIAGVDSGGGAGIAADLRAFASCGVHGTCVVTALTAQNTLGVRAIEEVAPEMVLAQFEAVNEDFEPAAVKVGMLGGAATAAAVARALASLPQDTPVVVDPVMFASTGKRLITPEAEEILVADIIPRASVLTPNLQEARALAGENSEPGPVGGVPANPAAATGARVAEADGGAAPDERALACALLDRLLALGARAVVLSGGHGLGRLGEGQHQGVTDLFRCAGDQEVVELSGERAPGGAAHGSGCTHSALIAAQLALGASPLEAARRARELTGAAITAGLRELGGGDGPVDVLGLGARRAAELRRRQAS